jgi:hypothetical protein
MTEIYSLPIPCPFNCSIAGSLGMGVVGAIYRGGKAGTIRKKLS